MTVSWPWTVHTIRFIPWVLLLLVAARARNRTAGAWVALLPAAALQVLVFSAAYVFANLPSMVAPVASAIMDPLLFLAMGLSFLWLTSDELERRAVPLAVFGAIGSLLIPGLFIGLGWALWFAVSWSDEMASFWGIMNIVGMIIPLGLFSGVVLSGLLIARFLCRRRFTWPRFHVGLFAAMLVVFLLPAGALLVLAVIQVAVMGDLADAMFMFVVALGACAVMVAVLYGMVAVYLEITRRVSVLRRRFFAILRLSEPHEEIPAADDSMPGEIQEDPT